MWWILNIRIFLYSCSVNFSWNICKHADVCKYKSSISPSAGLRETKIWPVKHKTQPPPPKKKKCNKMSHTPSHLSEKWIHNTFYCIISSLMKWFRLKPAGKVQDIHSQVFISMQPTWVNTLLLRWKLRHWICCSEEIFPIQFSFCSMF